MTSKELRQGFLNFFAEKGHKIVPSSSLIPADPSCLFTTAGMQQFKEYFLNNNSPYGKRVCSCQKCFRTSDIEEVGDEKHLTFLEMLGNFSFGDYFKEEAIKFAFEFLFKELKLPQDNVVFTVFEGDKLVPFDEESFLIWKKLGIPENKIKKCARADNFWGPTGEEGPCGPTTEIHFGDIELWNLVFNEYYQDKKKELRGLKQKGVDTGMGLERLVMIFQGKDSVYETDLFSPIFKEITSPGLVKSQRIIADHIKSSVFLISEGILSSNVERGYILRRILRRAIHRGKSLNLPDNFLISLSKKVIEIYQDIYPALKPKEADILTVIQNEEEKFGKSLEKGIRDTSSVVVQENFGGEEAYNWYATSGVPVDIIKEIAQEKGVKLNESFELDFEKTRTKHQEISRAGVKKKFGGVGKETTFEATKLHTATHLLHAALREVLGSHVKQMGSDVTPQRLRFDFSHPQKMTEEELKKVKDIVNQKIKEDSEVKKEEMSYQEAIKSGALAFFKERYPERVTVYSITELPKEAKVKKRTKFSSPPKAFSKEICAGPHAKRTSELGRHFEILKEESSGAGVRRIRAILR